MEIKPCINPKCSGKSEISIAPVMIARDRGGYQAECTECGVSGPMDRSRHGAIAEWNTISKVFYGTFSKNLVLLGDNEFLKNLISFCARKAGGGICAFSMARKHQFLKEISEECEKHGWDVLGDQKNVKSD